MFLKLCDMGLELSRPDQPMNGRLQIMGSSSGQFVKSDFSPNVEERDFFLFPYDMRHCVYPFNGTDETRRTLAANFNIHDSAEELKKYMSEREKELFDKKVKERDDETKSN